MIINLDYASFKRIAPISSSVYYSTNNQFMGSYWLNGVTIKHQASQVPATFLADFPLAVLALGLD